MSNSTSCRCFNLAHHALHQYVPCMTPFLKWPGGKRWFVSSHAELLPTDFRVYREPFLGSGAVFFHLNPQRAVLSDTNRELIATYRAIKSDALAIERRLRRHQSLHDDDHYYRTRNAPRTADLRTEAARFLYLNRTCFNGIYRVNLQGVFNVPRGTKTAVVLPTDDFAEVRRVLWRAKLESCDFEPAIDRAEPGDLVFADPPYTVRHNNNGFVKYNETLFSWADRTNYTSNPVRRRCSRRKVAAGGCRVGGRNSPTAASTAVTT